MKTTPNTARILAEAGFTEGEVVQLWFRKRLSALASDMQPLKTVNYILELSCELYPEEMLEELV